MAAPARFGGGGLGFGVRFTLEDEFSGVADQISASFARMDAEVSGQADHINASLGKLTAGVALIGAGVGMMAGWFKASDVRAVYQAYEVQFETLLGDAQRAADFMDKIKQDAADNPIFGSKSLVAANAAMIATGRITEDRSRNITNSLAEILAGVGKGDAELERMAVNLNGIASLGKATGMDLKQFISAGIPIFTLLEQSTGKTQEELQNMDVTLDMLEGAFKKATEAGGMFYGATDRMAKSTKGLKAAMEDGIELTLERIGNAIEPLTRGFYTFVANLADAARAFIASPFGQIAVKIAAVATGVTALSVILVGLKMVLFAVIPAIWAALAPMLPIIINIAIIVGAVILLNKTLNSSKPILFAFGLALMFATGIFGVLAGTIILVRRAIREFDEYFSNLKENLNNPPTGIIGFFVRMGALIKAVGSMFGGLGSTTWEVSDEMKAALESLGLWETAKNIWTWVVRFKQFFSGMVEGFKEAWSAIKEVWNAIAEAFAPVENLLDKFGIQLSGNMTALEKWKKAGKIAAYIIVGALLAVVGALVMISINAIIAGISMFFAFLPVILIIAAVIAIIYLLYQAIMIIIDSYADMVNTIGDALNSVGEFFSGIWEWFTELGSKMWDVGVSIVSGLWNGIKSMWGSFRDWINDAVGDIPILGSVINFGLDLVAAPWDLIDSVFNGDEEEAQQNSGWSGQSGNTIAPAPSPYADIANRQASYDAQSYGGHSTTEVSRTETVKNITIPIQLDSEVLVNKVVDGVSEKQEMNNSRGN